MPRTRGNLEAASIYEVDENGEENQGGHAVSCMFNPYEYTISKTNTFSEEPANDSNTPHAELSNSGPQTLKVKLTFDTYETGEDVTLETNKLWSFMMRSDNGSGSENERSETPQVAFEWGVFKFVSYITQMSQKFTLFKNDGTPVRATVDVTFTQYTDVNDYPDQNPTSGGGPNERVYRIIAGDRLDTIAGEIYRDTSKWRMIAEHNKISNPLRLQPGRILRIPIK
jgi:hypothetical protein